MKYIVFVSVALGLMLLYMLSIASANSAVSGDYYQILLYLNITLAAVLMVLICVQFFLLYKKIKSRVIGSRLNLRLVSAFALMAIIPGLIVYLVSVNFLSRSIESWFNVKVESALDGGLSLGQRALDIMLDDMKIKAANIAETFSLQTTHYEFGLLNDLREKSGIQDATLLSLQGRIMAVSSGDTSRFLPELPSAAQLQQAQYRTSGKIEPLSDKGLYLRVLTPVKSHELTSETLILQLLQPVPTSLSNTAQAVQEVYRDYQELSYSRDALKDIFKLTLTLVLMLAMLSALAIAFVLSRRLSQPLAVLSEGTRAIAAGNYSTMLPEQGKDELGVLVMSFNSMMQQLDDATMASEQNRIRLEAARGYLETILAHLSSGVLVINHIGELRTFNLVASEILGVNLQPYEYHLFTKISLQHRFLAEFVALIQRHFELTQAIGKENNELNQQLEIIHSKTNQKQLVLLRATRLPAAADSGFVVVFDDVTAMAQAQRDAAWGEVARRLAHEIKNPLTPIQLSAERLQHKLMAKLEKDESDILKCATETIVNQVGALKSMVNEFSEYARVPSANLVCINLNQLIQDVSGLYENTLPHISYDLAQNLPTVLGDVTLLRQLLHNLMQNAQDALHDVKEPRISIQTSYTDISVELTMRDNGHGFPEDLLAHAFEPYVTTKSHGSGLGLAIVKKMVEEHFGQIRIENNQDGGASITIVLPIENKDRNTN